MTLQQIIDAALLRLNKDEAGNPFSPESMTGVFRNASLDVYGSMVKQVMSISAQNNMPPEQIISRYFNELTRFMFRIDGSVIGGDVTIPSTSDRILSVFSRGLEADIDLVDPNTFDKRRTDILSPDPEGNPFATEIGGTLRVIPNNMSGGVLITSLKVPEEPYYDYCLDSGLNAVYMPVGSKLVDSGGQLNLVDSSDVLIRSNVTHLTGSDGYVSNSIELDWDESAHPMFVDYLLSDGAVNLREEFPYGDANKQS